MVMFGGVRLSNLLLQVSTADLGSYHRHINIKG